MKNIGGIFITNTTKKIVESINSEIKNIMSYIKKMEKTGYIILIFTLLMGLAIGLVFGSLSCSPTEESFYYPIELSSEIDRLRNVIDGKDEEIGMLNSAMSIMESGGHININVVECNYIDDYIRLKVENKLPIQAEVQCVGIIGDFVYTEDWLDDYSDDASGLIPAGGSRILIWNDSEAQSLNLDHSSGSIVMNNSTDGEDERYQTEFFEGDSYVVRVKCSDGIIYYTKIKGELE